MQRSVARPMRGAHDLAEVEPIVVRNFTPSLASFEFPDDCVEALTRRSRKQVRLFQASVAEARR